MSSSCARPGGALRFIDPASGAHIVLCDSKYVYAHDFRQREGFLECRIEDPARPGEWTPILCSAKCSDSCECQCHLCLVDLRRQRLGFVESSTFFDTSLLNRSLKGREVKSAAGVLLDYSMMLLIMVERFAQIGLFITVPQDEDEGGAFEQPVSVLQAFLLLFRGIDLSTSENWIRLVMSASGVKREKTVTGLDTVLSCLASSTRKQWLNERVRAICRKYECGTRDFPHAPRLSAEKVASLLEQCGVPNNSSDAAAGDAQSKGEESERTKVFIPLLLKHGIPETANYFSPIVTSSLKSGDTTGRSSSSTTTPPPTIYSRRFGGDKELDRDLSLEPNLWQSLTGGIGEGDSLVSGMRLRLGDYVMVACGEDSVSPDAPRWRFYCSRVEAIESSCVRVHFNGFQRCADETIYDFRRLRPHDEKTCSRHRHKHGSANGGKGATAAAAKKKTVTSSNEKKRQTTSPPPGSGGPRDTSKKMKRGARSGAADAGCTSSSATTRSGEMQLGGDMTPQSPATKKQTQTKNRPAAASPRYVVGNGVTCPRTPPRPPPLPEDFSDEDFETIVEDRKSSAVANASSGAQHNSAGTATATKPTPSPAPVGWNQLLQNLLPALNGANGGFFCPALGCNRIKPEAELLVHIKKKHPRLLLQN